jgi:hypothetical protein
LWITDQLVDNFNLTPEELRATLASIKIISESSDFEHWLKEIEAEGLLTLVGSFKAWERQKGVIAMQHSLIDSLRARIKQLEGNELHLHAENKGLHEAVVKLKEEFGLDH